MTRSVPCLSLYACHSANGTHSMLMKSTHDAQDLRRSNFTAADCRDCNFKNSKLQGTYFIKTVVARANFEVLPIVTTSSEIKTTVLCASHVCSPRGQCWVLGKPSVFAAQNADLSDVLMDRAVLNDSNLTNANLSRAILTR